MLEWFNFMLFSIYGTELVVTTKKVYLICNKMKVKLSMQSRS